jgi:hypothetical protein
MGIKNTSECLTYIESPHHSHLTQWVFEMLWIQRYWVTFSVTGDISIPLDHFLQPTGHGGDEVLEVVDVLHYGHPQIEHLLSALLCSGVAVHCWPSKRSWPSHLHDHPLVLHGEWFLALSHLADRAIKTLTHSI